MDDDNLLNINNSQEIYISQYQEAAMDVWGYAYKKPLK